jgi:dihydrofolate reductase
VLTGEALREGAALAATPFGLANPDGFGLLCSRPRPSARARHWPRRPVGLANPVGFEAASAYTVPFQAPAEKHSMARLIFALNQSLDGYVDHMAFAPDPVLFRHFIEDVQSLSGSIYGRRMYEVMRYWDEDQPEWDAAERDYAAAWRSKPKWVVSSTLKSVGPNATLVADDLEGTIARLKAELDGEIEVSGPELALGLGNLGLVDEYRLYIHPVVLGGGKPLFAGPRPPLRLVASERIGPQVIRLTYVPV